MATKKPPPKHKPSPLSFRPSNPLMRDTILERARLQQMPLSSYLDRLVTVALCLSDAEISQRLDAAR
jgi:hypothetical protein